MFINTPVPLTGTSGSVRAARQVVERRVLFPDESEAESTYILSLWVACNEREKDGEEMRKRKRARESGLFDAQALTEEVLILSSGWLSRCNWSAWAPVGCYTWMLCRVLGGPSLYVHVPTHHVGATRHGRI